MKQKKCFLRFDDLCTKSKRYVCRHLYGVANAIKKFNYAAAVNTR